MPTERLPLVLLALSLFLAAAGTGGAAAGQEKPLAPLKIIYAGEVGTDHCRSFEKFLSKHFASVEAIPVLDLAKADLSGGDLLIVDGDVFERDADGNRGDIKKGPEGLTLEKLSIPTVLIGGMGGRVSDSLKLKLGWRWG